MLERPVTQERSVARSFSIAFKKLLGKVGTKPDQFLKKTSKRLNRNLENYKTLLASLEKNIKQADDLIDFFQKTNSKPVSDTLANARVQMEQRKKALSRIEEQSELERHKKNFAEWDQIRGELGIDVYDIPDESHEELQFNMPEQWDTSTFSEIEMQFRLEESAKIDTEHIISELQHERMVARAPRNANYNYKLYEFHSISLNDLPLHLRKEIAGVIMRERQLYAELRMTPEAFEDAFEHPDQPLHFGPSNKKSISLAEFEQRKRKAYGDARWNYVIDRLLIAKNMIDIKDRLAFITKDLETMTEEVELASVG